MSRGSKVARIINEFHNKCVQRGGPGNEAGPAAQLASYAQLRLRMRVFSSPAPFLTWYIIGERERANLVVRLTTIFL